MGARPPSPRLRGDGHTGEEEWPLTSVHGRPIERDLESVDRRLRGRRELEA
jgi:hypothetical protein